MGFQEKFKETVSKGLEQSKNIFGAAKDKAKELGDSGILRFEIRQLNDKIKKEEHALGHAAYELLAVEGKQSVTRKTAGVKELIDTIEDLNTQVTAKRIVLTDLESREAEAVKKAEKPEDSGKKSTE
jgi:hypothetical protein